MAAIVPVGSLPQLVPAGPSSQSSTGTSPACAHLHSSIVVQNGPCGTGGFVTQDIAYNDTIGFVPYDYILSETYALNTEVGRAAWALRAGNAVDIIGRTVLYLVMIAERESSTARFHTYMKSLPAVYDDAVCWTDEELAAYLQGSNLLEGAKHRQVWLRRCYSAFFPALHESHPQLFPPQVFTYAAFQWAHSAFSSRCFPHLLSVPPPARPLGLRAPVGRDDGPHDHAQEQEGSVHAQPPAAEPGPDVNPFGYSDGTAVGCMLPVVDVLNHKARTPIAWRREGDGVRFVAGAKEGGAGVFAKAGEEVFNNYGPKSNEELVLGYGFALPHNGDDTYSLVTRRPPPMQGGTGSGSDMLGQALQSAGLPSRHVLTVGDPSRPGSGSLPPSLLSYLRAVVLQEGLDYYAWGAEQQQEQEGEGEELPHCLQQYRSACSSPGGASALLASPLQDASVECRMLAVLHAQLSHRLAALEAHQPWLSGGKQAAPVQSTPASSRSPYRAHIARLYITGQRDILCAALGQCDSLMRHALAHLLCSTGSSAAAGAGAAAAEQQSTTHVDLAVPAGACLHPWLTASTEGCIYLHPPPPPPSPGQEEADAGSSSAWTPLVTLPASSPSCTPVMPCTLTSLRAALGEALGEGTGEEEDLASSLVLQAYTLALWLYRRWAALEAAPTPPGDPLTALAAGMLHACREAVQQGGSTAVPVTHSWAQVQACALSTLQNLLSSEEGLSAKQSVWPRLLGLAREAGSRGKGRKGKEGRGSHKRARTEDEEEGGSMEEAATLLGMAFIAVHQYAVPLHWGEQGLQLAFLPLWPLPTPLPSSTAGRRAGVTGITGAWFVETAGGETAVRLCVPTVDLQGARASSPAPVHIHLHPSFPSLAALHAVQALDSPPVPHAWVREMEGILQALDSPPVPRAWVREMEGILLGQASAGEGTGEEEEEQ